MNQVLYASIVVVFSLQPIPAQAQYEGDRGYRFPRDYQAEDGESRQGQPSGRAEGNGHRGYYRPRQDYGEPDTSGEETFRDDEPRQGGRRRRDEVPQRYRGPDSPRGFQERQGADASATGANETLYVGAQPGCNAGVVTTDPRFQGCATNPIGSTASDGGGGNTAIFVGTTEGVNAGVVTNNPRHLGGDTRPIGYLLAARSGGTRIFVGVQASCNAGVATTNPTHLNCRTVPLGSTSR